MTLMGGWYQSYRDRAKRRGRDKKAKVHLERMQSLYRLFVSPDSLCFDVGANMGNRTEALLNLGARVVAVEPQPACVQELRRRFGCNHRATIVDQAVDTEPGEKEIYICSSNTLSSMSPDWIEKASQNPHFEGCRWDDKVTVQTTTLDLLVKTYGQPAFCKIDVEGFEPNVIGGLSHPIACLSVEFASNQPERYQPCLDRLSTLGVYEFNYSIGESMTLTLDQWIRAETLRKTLDGLAAGPITGGDIYARMEK